MGSIIRADHMIYPIKEGIFIPFFSDIDLTIIFGAFPIYVMDPITTELIDIATSISFWTYINSWGFPPAILKKRRYEGALSRKDDAIPHIQK